VRSNLPYFSLKAFLASSQSHCSIIQQMQIIFDQEISTEVIKSFTTLSILLPVVLSVSGYQKIKSSFKKVFFKAASDKRK
jgi:hypothetical protein